MREALRGLASHVLFIEYLCVLCEDTPRTQQRAPCAGITAEQWIFVSLSRHVLTVQGRLQP